MKANELIIESEAASSGKPTIMKNNLNGILFEPRPTKDGEHHPTVEDVINLVKEAFTSGMEKDYDKPTSL